jgi:hypothetical protein
MILSTAGTDVVGNIYRLIFLSGSGSVAISKTSVAGETTYGLLSISPSRLTFVRTQTAFLLADYSTSYGGIYRLNNNGSLTLIIGGPSASSVVAPIIGENDVVTYTVRVSASPGNTDAYNIFAPVCAVPYLHPALASDTLVPFAASPALSLSTNVYSSLTISYQWSYNGAAISGATQAIYGGPFLGAGAYSLVANTSGGTVSSSTQVQLSVGGVVVGPAPTFLANPVGAKIVLGSSLALRATAAATAPVSLQWALNGIPITGANTTTASTVNYGAYDSTFTATQPGTYTVVATTADSHGGPVTSTAATLEVITSAGVTVLPVPTILAQPASVNALYADGAVTPTGLAVTAVATLPMTYQWLLDGTAIPSAIEVTYSAIRPGSYSVVVSTTAGTVTSRAVVVTVVTSGGVVVTDAPTILTQPQGAGVVFGAGLGLPTLTVSGVALQAMSYQWFLNGMLITGANSPAYKASAVGTYTATITTGVGSVTSAPAVVSLVNRLANISGRCQVGTGANIGIAGFVVSSYTGAAKQFLIRGVGPSLGQFGLSGTLAQPVLSVFDSKGRAVATNAGWSGAAEIATAGMAVGAFPLVAGSADTALVLNLTPGAYTAQIAGVGGVTGVALIEVYEVLPDAGQLLNISERAFVGSGANILISGFVTAGSRPSKVLVRAVGPGLGQFGLSGALTQPILSVYDARGALIGVNTGWSAGGSAEAITINNASAGAGAFLLQPGSGDCAVLLLLPPGAYTAQVSGTNGSTGVALVEVYQVPQ